MASRNQQAQLINRIFSITFLCILFYVLAFPSQVYAKETTVTLPSLSNFIESVKDGSVNTLRGIYVANVMAFPVVQQPSGNPGYVSSTGSVTTQFKMASELGNIGLLAHNYLAGAVFSQLKSGDIITLVYGDGNTEGFLVESILQYQAISPLSPYSNFVDLATQTTITAEQLFNKVYRGEYHLTLQTCIARDGNISWGRLFIVATPIENENIITNEIAWSASDTFAHKWHVQ